MAETAFQTINIAAPVARVYSIAGDFERYPEWAKDVKEATVRSRDSEGRPVEVEFRASALGRSTHYTLSYDYPKGVKMSFTQVFFHPQGLPGGGQYYYVYGTKGAVDVLNGKFYPRGVGGPPETIFQPVREKDDPHVAAFYDAIRTGKQPPAGIEIGASAALTAILGREAIYNKTVTRWSDFHSEI